MNAKTQVLSKYFNFWLDILLNENFKADTLELFFDNLIFKMYQSENILRWKHFGIFVDGGVLE